MKELKTLSNQELHLKTLQAAEREKIATLDLLEHLEEVYKRKLFLDYGYSSLWQYVHKELKYSEPQSSERVHSLHLMLKVPELKTEIKSGNITLTATAALSRHVRKENLSKEESKELLSQIIGKSTRAVEKILNPDDLRKMTIQVDEEFLELLERVKQLKGHSGSKPEELFKLLMKEVIQKDEKQIQKHTKLSAPKVVSNQTRYTPVNSKVQITIRSNHQCEYVSAINNKRCEAKTNLEIDHIHPYAKGGTNELQNLRQLCKAHNQFAAVQEYGEGKMKSYLKLR